MADKVSIEIDVEFKAKPKKATTPKKKKKSGVVPETGKAPLPSPKSENRGGIYGGRTDENVIYSKKAKQVRGGLPTAMGGAGVERDTVSRQAVEYERWIDKVRRLEQGAMSAKAVEGIVKNHMGRLVQGSDLLTNPQGFIGKEVLGMLKGAGPYGIAITAAITAIAASIETAEKLIKHFSQKGWSLNNDWRRTLEEEVNALFDILDKKKRLLGIDAFIVTQTDRYQPETGATTYNSYENRREIVTSKVIGASEKSVGVE